MKLKPFAHGSRSYHLAPLKLSSISILKLLISDKNQKSLLFRTILESFLSKKLFLSNAIPSAIKKRTLEFF